MKINKILYFLDFPNGFGGEANTLLKQEEMVREYISDVLITIQLDDNVFTIKEFEERCKQSKLRYTYQKYSVLFTTELVDVISLSEDYTRIEEYIEQYKPDIVHSTQINVCVEMACRKLGIPHVMNIYQCTEYMFQLKYPNIFPHYHICDSIYYLNRWKKRLDLDSVCIRNMCQKIEEKKWRYEIPRLVCVGILSESKNQLEVIKAIYKLILSKIFVSICFLGYADNIYGKKCIDYVNQNNLTQWIKIKGFVSNANKEIAKYDALICGSVHESFPNVIGEAMAGETIVISTPIAGVPEILKDEVNSYLCDGFRTENIFTAIKKFYLQRGTQKQKEILENANKTYFLEFSPKSVAKKLMIYYEHVYQDYSVKTCSKIQREIILKLYNSYIEIFRENERNFTDSKKIRNMLWLIPHIRKILEKNQKEELIIWGAGEYGKAAMEFSHLYFPYLKIRCFVDQNRQGEYMGYPIMKLENVNWENSVVWIAFVYKQIKAVKILLELGLEYHKDFFFLAPMNL